MTLPTLSFQTSGYKLLREYIPCVVSHHVCHSNPDKRTKPGSADSRTHVLSPTSMLLEHKGGNKKSLQTPETMSSLTEDLNLRNVDFLLLTNASVMNYL